MPSASGHISNVASAEAICKNVATRPPVAEGGFGKRIKEAIERKRGKLPTQKQHAEQTEHDRKHYKPLREPTKGE